jgi:hypothetical protein
MKFQLTINNMKIKIILILTTLVTSLNAQTWSGTTPGNIFYNSGNVGIGTSSTTAANLHIGKQEASAGSSGEVLRLSLQPYGHTGGPWHFKSRDIPQFAFLDIMYGTIPALTLNSSGNIGIGTVSTTSANLNLGKQEASAGSSGEILRLSIQPYGHTGGPWYFKSRDNSQYAYLDIMYGTIPALTLNSSGNIGIGTGSANPTAKLTVAGDINSREVRVTINAGSDFVFNDNYDLRTLTEVEHFIRQNKHLPDIEPAKEMEEKGLELGKMDMKLLQKIEELTIYMIELNKEIEKLKEENKKLKEEIVELKKD